MILKYDFDGENFEYEINFVDYMRMVMTIEEIGNLAYDIYTDVLSNKQVEDIKKDYEDYTLPDAFKTSDIYDKDLLGLAYDIITETDDNVLLDMIGDKIKDYYEEDAREAWKEYGDYATDPYGSIGMRQRDFL